MGTMLEALRHLQSIEYDLAQVRGRLRTRKSAVVRQQRKIDEHQTDWKALHDQGLSKRAEADHQELELKSREEQVSRFRTGLNTAKTNKEYAAILTQINTLKADNAKLEEEILKAMQEVDSISLDAEKLKEVVEAEGRRLEEITRSNKAEIDRLSKMLEELSAKRSEAAEAIAPDVLAVFDRIAESYDGEAMAVVEVHGSKPPYSYVCGGCFMSLNPEHANALQTRDEIRTCDNCRRILYLEPETEGSRA